MMTVEEFNEKYEVIVDSIASTQLELVEYDLNGEQVVDVDYIRLLDGQTNFKYVVKDKETEEEKLVIKSERDTVAVAKIKDFFDIK